MGWSGEKTDTEKVWKNWNDGCIVNTKRVANDQKWEIGFPCQGWFQMFLNLDGNKWCVYWWSINWQNPWKKQNANWYYPNLPIDVSNLKNTSPDLCKDILCPNGHPCMGLSSHKGLAACSGERLSWGRNFSLFLWRIQKANLWSLFTSSPWWCRACLVLVWSSCPVRSAPFSSRDMLGMFGIKEENIW